jgi:hypothetical protein
MPSVIGLARQERAVLNTWVRDPEPQHLGRAICALIVLLADEGWSNTRIAQWLGVHWNTVVDWRESFASERLRCFERPISRQIGRSMKRRISEYYSTLSQV